MFEYKHFEFYPLDIIKISLNYALEKRKACFFDDILFSNRNINIPSYYLETVQSISSFNYLKRN
jgi:hypothetical protein